MFGLWQKVIGRHSFSYADLRQEMSLSENIVLEDSRISSFNHDTISGFSVRVLYKNGWGLSSTTDGLDAKTLEREFRNALKIARIFGEKSGLKRKIPEIKVHKAEYRTDFKTDPFDVDKAEKITKLGEIEKSLKSSKLIHTTTSFFKASKENILFMNSIGSDIRQEFVTTSMGYLAVGRKGDVIQRTFEREHKSSGYEMIERYNINDKTKKSIEQIKRLLDAGYCPPGYYPVVLDAGMTGLLFHEAVGHSCEADSILQNLSSLNGKEGKTIASDKVTVVDTPNFGESAANYAFDDEGIKATEVKLIEKGAFAEKLHSLDSAMVMGEKPNSHGRGLNFSFFPIPRMANTILKPGEFKEEELFEGIKKGVYLKDWRAGNADPKAGRFTYAAGEAFMIENGRITKPMRDVILSGNIFETLKSISKVGNKIELEYKGGFCGKHEQFPLRVGSFSPLIKIERAMIGGRNN